MEIEYLKRRDRIIKKAGTKDPDDVLAFMGYEYVDCGDSILGFIAKCKTGVFVDVLPLDDVPKSLVGQMLQDFHCFVLKYKMTAADDSTLLSDP